MSPSESAAQAARDPASDREALESERAHREGNGAETADQDQTASAANLKQLFEALQAVRAGDFSVRLPSHQGGLFDRVVDSFNDIVAANQQMAQQLDRVGQVVGRDGQTKTRVRFGLSSGAWGDMEESVNNLIDDLVWPTSQVTRTISAVAKGDLLQNMPLDVEGRPLKGEFLRSATIVNTMIKQLSVFTSEVTRVAREVGTDGKLG
ncbi:MAG TPA: hybrid sensor histidine kinase/response regulator, partial [Methylovirgula sp.]|nr:hybrid sensor histidine kinase/response regulator [Methylovirgula sp.]